MNTVARQVTNIELGGSAAQPSSPRDYWVLMKPNVMQLVVFTGGVGVYLAPGAIHPLLAFVAVLCIAVGAGASAAINNAYDVDIDQRMARTRRRPTADGRIAPAEALGAGLTLAILSVMLMGMAVGWLAAGLLAFTIFFYTVVYTMGLKRRTPQNIVIGGAAGAFPPMIGWAAVTGEVGVMPVLLFLLIFTWTPPHFWSLALYRRDDYARVGVPMLPVVAGPGEHALAHPVLFHAPRARCRASGHHRQCRLALSGDRRRHERALRGNGLEAAHSPIGQAGHGVVQVLDRLSLLPVPRVGARSCVRQRSAVLSGGRNIRAKNIVVALALLAFVVIVYLVSIVRMGGA